MSYRDPVKQKEAQRQSYLRRKPDIMGSQARRRRDRRAWVRAYKAEHPCEHCGESHVGCLEFHHREGVEKRLDINGAIHDNWSEVNLLAELEKCMILCANCHRKIHWNADGTPSDPVLFSGKNKRTADQSLF